MPQSSNAWDDNRDPFGDIVRYSLSDGWPSDFAPDAIGDGEFAFQTFGAIEAGNGEVALGVMHPEGDIVEVHLNVQPVTNRFGRRIGTSVELDTARPLTEVVATLVAAIQERWRAFLATDGYGFSCFIPSSGARALAVAR